MDERQKAQSDEEIIRQTYWDIKNVKVDWIKDYFDINIGSIIKIVQPLDYTALCIHCQKNELNFRVKNRSELWNIKRMTDDPYSVLKDLTPPYVAKSQFQFSRETCTTFR